MTTSTIPRSEYDVRVDDFLRQGGITMTVTLTGSGPFSGEEPGPGVMLHDIYLVTFTRQRADGRHLRPVRVRDAAL